MNLLALDEVQRRLRITGQTYRGTCPIEVRRVIGSLDRSTDFDRDFTPRHRSSVQRLAALSAAFPDGQMPAISVYEVGGAYFVVDGHHRVALARGRAADYIDADVTRLQTNYEIGPDVDVRQLVHTEQQRALLEESGLAVARPDAVIEFARPNGYAELLELIKAHGYDLARRRGSLPAPEEVAADWYDGVFLPAVAALRAESLPQLHPHKTEADLFLWVYQRQRAMRVLRPEADFAEAAAQAREQRISRRDRREFERGSSTPLPPRR